MLLGLYECFAIVAVFARLGPIALWPLLEDRVA